MNFQNLFYKKKFVSLIILFYLLLDSFLETQTWKKYYLNPILGDKDTGTVFDPFIIKYNNSYQMYVSWRNKGSIALSSSKDGIKWSKLKLVLNKGKPHSWESIVNRACVIITLLINRIQL